MALDINFLSPDDKPALIGLTTGSWCQTIKQALEQQDYKVRAVDSHEDWMKQFSLIPYHLVFLEETFAGADLSNHPSLQSIQSMAMNQRRHAIIFLIGQSFTTLDTAQAFQQSVHAVVNPADLESLAQIIQSVVAENDTFLHTFRDTQKHIAQGN